MTRKVAMIRGIDFNDMDDIWVMDVDNIPEERVKEIICEEYDTSVSEFNSLEIEWEIREIHVAVEK